MPILPPLSFSGTLCCETLTPSRSTESSQDEAERIVLRHDLARRRRREMGSDAERFAISVALTKRAAGLLGLRPVHIEHVVPFRVATLNWMMHQVAGDHSVLAPGGNPHREVPGSVTGGRLEPDLIGDLVVVVHQLAHSFGHHRAYGVLDGIFQKWIFGAREEIPLGSADQVLRIGKGWHPLVIPQLRVPADVIVV